jgi:hypothetical protein
MALTAAMSRLVGWIVVQDEVLQAHVLGHFGGNLLRDLAARALEQRNQDRP